MSGNLLVLMSDEHQARAMGCAGHPFVQTPHLDALAARGVRFTDAYTPSPICVPARAAFATGRPVHQIGYWDNAMGYDGRVRGWGHALQEAGVPVESIGKLHYRRAEDPVGFDAMHNPMMIVDGVGMVWGSIRDEAQRRSPPTRMLGPEIGPGTSAYTDYDQSVVARTKDWLAARAQDPRPLCLYVGLVAPHFPLVVPERFYDLYRDTPLPPLKSHPEDGHPRHPWVEKQNALMDSEAHFTDAAERDRARRAYYGLCSWVDHNVGEILATLADSGQAEDTMVIYTSDHGDNLGARGLWGKSNHYEESVAVPLIMAGPGIETGTCATPVSLIDVAASIPAHFNLPVEGTGRPLPEIAAAPPETDRVVFSEYHAAGSVSGAFMLRKGRWKYIHYVGFAPELFDLVTDPEEISNLADSNPDVLARMRAELARICDPDQVNAAAFADQAALIDAYGGIEAARNLGAPGATPPPAS